ncbi:MAG: hypothetical protein MZU91_12285 [Desulfosudis oleivorans]|nr:hypothetical protein [Desulfosudis oleivorans]
MGSASSRAIEPVPAKSSDLQRRWPGVRPDCVTPRRRSKLRFRNQRRRFDETPPPHGWQPAGWPSACARRCAADTADAHRHHRGDPGRPGGLPLPLGRLPVAAHGRPGWRSWRATNTSRSSTCCRQRRDRRGLDLRLPLCALPVPAAAAGGAAVPGPAAVPVAT